MKNAGYTDLREKIADMNSVKSGLDFSLNNVIMTCGAAGGLNCWPDRWINGLIDITQKDLSKLV